MALKRLSLPDGQWADLLVRPLHEDYVAILEAAEQASGVMGTMTEWHVTIGRQYCKAWSVHDENGVALDVSDWGKADPDITDAICTEALNRWDEWQEQRVPLVARRGRRSTPKASETPSEPTSADDQSSSPTTG